MPANVSLRYDFRFTLEENWNICMGAVQEAQERGVLTTPLTVFGEEGRIIGWYLHGWVPPTPKILQNTYEISEIAQQTQTKQPETCATV